MSKPVLYAAAAVVVVGTFLGTSRYVGGAVEEEVARFEASLAGLDHVQVYRFSYERRFFDGELHYDVTVIPLPDEPLHALLRETLGEGVDSGMRLTGSVAVRHGPWLGGSAGFGLARMDGGLPLPEMLRPLLPNYPGQRPLVETEAVVGFSRTVAAHFKGIDYRGKVVAEDGGTAGTLVFAGLEGWSRFDSGIDWLRFEARLGELSIEIAGPDPVHSAVRDVFAHADVKRGTFWTGRVEGGLGGWTLGSNEVDMRVDGVRAKSELLPRRVQGGAEQLTARIDGGLDGLQLEVRGAEPATLRFGAMKMDGDIVQAWPSLWLGKVDTRIEGARVAGRNSSVEFGAVTISSDTRARDGAVDQQIGVDLRRLSINSIPLGGGRLDLSVKGVDGEALDSLVGAIERSGNDPEIFSRPEFLALVQAAMPRLLARPLSFGIDSLRLDVLQEGDVRANFGLTFAGEPALDLGDAEVMLERLGAEVGFAVRSEALKELVRIGMETALAKSLPAGAPAPDPEFVARETEQRFSDLMLAAAQTSFLRVSADGIRAEAVYRDRVFTINGEPVADTDAMAALAAMGELFDGGDEVSGTRGVAMGQGAEGMFATLRLEAGFMPDPYEVALLAGGATELDGELGAECVGHVNVEQPEVVFEYVADGSPLYFFVESGDDTSLLVRGPDGTWYCSDDGPDRGLDPLVWLPEPQGGRYDVWVGTLGEALADATLMISEVAP
ncbi:MAG TPA: DUF945 family protein [Rhodocyclaceae bacterium]|nr:DUF945 family protein [Rhodocyclaceae bacterium]HRQ47263.1 DUF945 family protein [Rhodocyclaceae bacterium]